MPSYQLGMDSELIVGLHSSLLFELFGMQKKLFFCGSASTDLSGKWNNSSQYSLLPNEVSLNNWDYEEFKEKTHALLEMNDNDFINMTEKAREHYMNFGDEYPHQIIYKVIQDKCKQQ